MEISATSDIHYPSNAECLEEVIKQINDSEIVVIAGDIGDTLNRFSSALQKFKRFSGTKIAVMGNHDVYLERGFSSMEKVPELSRICREHGFCLLDKEPVIVGGVGFVGNIGWYDYQFAQTRLDERISVFRGNRIQSIPLSELKDADFATKRFKINGRWVSWADGENIDWSYSDKGFLSLQVDKLRNDLKKVTPEVDKIVYVSHHVPIHNLLEIRPFDAEWSVFNAYQGSQRLGDIALANPKVRAIICGHSHLYRKASVHKVQCYDVSRELGELTRTEIKI
ncbi:metallophosphoesterase [Candidatus Woesearchaeota archaeon]|nr:metallophosphoesterase [Candidatus Woesearchaeota archaeon]